MSIPSGNASLVEGLQRSLREHPRWAGAQLSPLQDTGLAHLHVRLCGTDVLARIPKQSQVGLAPAANLRHQAACFERAHAGGRAPRLVAVLEPTEHLPRGALLVEEIAGEPARLPRDLDAIAQSLAALHSLALPAPPERPPLQDAADPLGQLHDEIAAQASFAPRAGLAAAVRAGIEAGVEALERQVAAPDRPPRCLIAFDAHPGNFLMRPDGPAVLVDLEKCRYSHPGLDLAHATLYTSTTWDVSSQATLVPAEVAGFYRAWERAAGAQLAAASKPWHLPLRHAMWLWSLTWCCKWRIESAQPPAHPGRGEDWSGALSEEALVRHVRERVDDYLSPGSVAFVQEEMALLPRLLEA